MRKLLILLSLSIALAACAASVENAAPGESAAVPEAAPPATLAAPRPQIGSFGFDIAGMDRGSDPGDNFYMFANGAWERATEIPADRSNYGMFTMLDDLSKSRTRAIVEEAAAQPGSRIGDFYASFMDEARIEGAGIAPIRPMLAEVQAIRSRADFAAQLGRMLRQGRPGLRGSVANRRRVPTETIVRLGQSGLGLPDRDYYLRNEAALTSSATPIFPISPNCDLGRRAQRRAPRRRDPRLRDAARPGALDPVENRDDEKTYNKMNPAALARLARASTGRAISPRRASPASRMFWFRSRAHHRLRPRRRPDPGEVLRDYATVRLVDAAAPYLSSGFVDAHFAYHGTASAARRRTSRAGSAGDFGQRGARRRGQPHLCRPAFPAGSEGGGRPARPQRHRGDGPAAREPQLDAPETRQRARAKLAAFTPKIGYPDRWRDYSSVQGAATISSAT